SDHNLELAEHPHEPSCERRRGVAVAAVRMELPAARLRVREHDLVPESLEDRDRRPADLREDRVADAGDEQRDSHASAHMKAQIRFSIATQATTTPSSRATSTSTSPTKPQAAYSGTPASVASSESR